MKPRPSPGLSGTLRRLKRAYIATGMTPEEANAKVRALLKAVAS